MNPKQGLFVTPQIPKEPVKDNSPKKRQSNSRLSDLRESKQ